MGKRRRYRNNPQKFGRKYALKYSIQTSSEPATPLESAVGEPSPSITLEAPPEDAPAAPLEVAEKTEAPPPKKRATSKKKATTISRKTTRKKATKAKTTT